MRISRHREAAPQPIYAPMPASMPAMAPAAGPVGGAAAPAAAAPAEEEEAGFPVTSPMVGTFYESSSPGAKPFVGVDILAGGEGKLLVASGFFLKLNQSMLGA